MKLPPTAAELPTRHSSWIRYHTLKALSCRAPQLVFACDFRNCGPTLKFAAARHGVGSLTYRVVVPLSFSDFPQLVVYRALTRQAEIDDHDPERPKLLASQSCCAGAPIRNRHNTDLSWLSC